eukprot:jgi/Chrpa1/13405/Chrysochromulina_OHIO_Genome00019758-RA
MEVPSIQAPNQLPPTTVAAVTSEPSCQQFHPGSAAAAMRSGPPVARPTMATPRKRARGIVLPGLSTSPAMVEAQSKPVMLQYRVESNVPQSYCGGSRIRLPMLIWGSPTAQSTKKGASANAHSKVRKSPTTLDEIKLGRQKKTRMPSLMPYSSAQPDCGSNIHSHRLRAPGSSSSSSSAAAAVELLMHVAPLFGTNPVLKPRPERSCCAAA